MSITLNKQRMQMQSAYNNKSDKRMIGISVYIILLDKIGKLHTKPLWIEYNINRRMVVMSLKKSSLCIAEVFPMLLS